MHAPNPNKPQEQSSRGGVAEAVSRNGRRSAGRVLRYCLLLCAHHPQVGANKNGKKAADCS